MTSTTNRPAPSRRPATTRPQTAQPSFMANNANRPQTPSTFQPATPPVPASEPNVDYFGGEFFRTAEGAIWLDEECSEATVNEVAGEVVLNNDGSQLIIVDQYNQYLATAPNTDQCNAVHRMLAQTQVNPQPATNGGFIDPNTIWIDENCDLAEVSGVPGHVLQDESGHLYIESGGDFPTTLAEVPTGVFAQCDY